MSWPPLENCAESVPWLCATTLLAVVLELVSPVPLISARVDDWLPVVRLDTDITLTSG
jgi:hypothetical protein